MNEREPRRWIEDELAQPRDFRRTYTVFESRSPDTARREALWERLAPQLSIATVAEQSRRKVLPKSAWYALGALSVILAASFYASVWRRPPIRTQDTERRQLRSTPLQHPGTQASASDAAATLEPLAQATTATIRSAARAPTIDGTGRRRYARAAGARPTERASASEPNAQLEVELLMRARRVLDALPARALVLTQQHQQLFAHGTFAEEREVIAIDALQRLGRADAARLRARVFLRDYPRSAHRSHVAQAVHTHERAAPSRGLMP